MSMCRVFSCVLGRGCLLWLVHSLGKTILAFTVLHSVLQGKICQLLQVFLDFLLLHSSSIMKGHLFWMLVLKGLVGLHKTIQLQLLQSYWSGHRLGLPWYEWFALQMNRDYSVIFETLLTMRATPFLLRDCCPFQSILVCWFLECRCSLLPSPVSQLPICLDSWI